MTSPKRRRRRRLLLRRRPMSAGWRMLSARRLPFCAFSRHQRRHQQQQRLHRRHAALHQIGVIRLCRWETADFLRQREMTSTITTTITILVAARTLILTLTPSLRHRGQIPPSSTANWTSATPASKLSLVHRGRRRRPSKLTTQPTL